MQRNTGNKKKIESGNIQGFHSLMTGLNLSSTKNTTFMASLEKMLEKSRRDLQVYKAQWPTLSGNIALHWVQRNFEIQGYRNRTYIPWHATKKKATKKFGGSGNNILYKSGKLYRSIKVQPLAAGFRLYTRNPYARIHNDGFKGTQTVRAHQRRKMLSGTIEGNGVTVLMGARRSIKTRRNLKPAKVVGNISTIKEFTRTMNMPRRQFMPSSQRGSEMLFKELREKTMKDVQKILSIVKT